MIEIRGIGISGKKVNGIAYWYQKRKTKYHSDTKSNIEEKKERFIKIKNIAKKEIDKLYQEALKDNLDTAEIFTSHKLILDDKEIFDYILNLINQGYDLESALIRTKDDVKMHFTNMESEIFRTKVCDIDDVFCRLIKIENGILNEVKFPNKPFILICDEILPSLIYQIPSIYLKGIIVKFGSNCSHGAILAKTKNIPVIIRLKNRIDVIKNNKMIVMNGELGVVYILDD